MPADHVGLVIAAHALLFLLATPTPAGAQCAGTSGRVVDHLTGEPIVGAQVSGGVGSTALTDANGCFVLATVYTENCRPMLVDCAYRFGITAQGYVPYGEYGYRPPPDISPFYAEVRLAPLAAALCTGGCGDDHAVGIDELLCAVDALLSDTASGCTCADRDGDGRLHIAEVLGAVRNALTGCVDCGPAAPTFRTPPYPPPCDAAGHWCALTGGRDVGGGHRHLRRGVDRLPLTPTGDARARRRRTSARELADPLRAVTAARRALRFRGFHASYARGAIDPVRPPDAVFCRCAAPLPASSSIHPQTLALTPRSPPPHAGIS